MAALSFLQATNASPAQSAELTPIEKLGKNVFFDTNLSKPESSQACASCHDPAKGWILPNSEINRTIVVAPGAKRRRLGSIKTPPNAYASFSPPFANVDAGGFVAPWLGGVFWDGRAEGCGSSVVDPNPPPCQIGGGAVSETVTWSDLPPQYRNRETGYVRFLGPTADQALNPFPNDVEQNIREKKVCKAVEIARYGSLYPQAFGVPINCKNTPPGPNGDPPYRTSFKRLAVALAAWQASNEVNSFTSKRDAALEAASRKQFPLPGLSPKENLGHDLFYGTNDSGRNPARTFANPPSPRVPSGGCNACHNGVPQGEVRDPSGTNPRQLYTDFRYHNIGVPFNREIPTVLKFEKKGLSAHEPTAPDGLFKTPTIRNVAKGASRYFTKAYTHNGWFKSLESLVHFYNTRDVLPKCEDPPISIVDATEAQALAKGCWPKSEFDNPAGFIIGRNGLTPEEEDAIVAYLETLSDSYTPKKP